jgi:hypothetical protein
MWGRGVNEAMAIGALIMGYCDDSQWHTNPPHETHGRAIL